MISRTKRRIGAAKPPLSVALSYQAILRRYLTAFQARLEDIALAGWEHNPHSQGRLDATASDYVRKRIGQAEILLAEIFNPTKLAGEIKILATRVSKKGLLEFQRTIGVSPRGDLGIGHTLDAFRDRNVKLIRSLANDQIKVIRETLGEAEQKAWRVEVLRSKIQEDFGVTKSKADLLARDQVLKLNGQITQTRQQGAGIEEYLWTTSRDERVRGTPGGKWPSGLHYDLDGTRQRWDTPPIISEDGRTGHPGEDYQCRCTAFPILAELEQA